MALETYRRKRNFARTPEPRGTPRPHGNGLAYLVQKHAASHLHYDFRLELDGVLKSWAVPKGPSLDPKHPRLAVAVEDHPVEYADFEGVIPAGEYGGGTVVLWDRGTWAPLDDPHEGLRQGKLKFELHGQKLRGQWILIRTAAARGKTANQWLLRKIQDGDAHPQAEYDVLAEQPKSVATKRNVAEVARDRDRVWNGDGSGNGRAQRPAQQRERSNSLKKNGAPRRPRRRTALPTAARRAAMPKTIKLALATLVAAAPDGDQWLHEIKFDGYRMLCLLAKGRVTLLTRGQQDWTARFPTLVQAAEGLPCERAILDGEIIMPLPNGASNFQELQNVLHEGRQDRLLYQVFDLLYLDGYDLRPAKLEDRKAALAQLVAALPPQGPLRFTEHVVGRGPDFYRQCCRLGLEGTIAKRRDRPYPSARSSDWLKAKCLARQEFVIGGYTDSTDRARKLGAIQVGYYDPHGKLLYAGRVGTGWNARSLADLHARLAKLARQQCPFAECPEAARRGLHWVQPRLVAEVAFGNWTRDGRLRHPSFQGLREDKPPDAIRRETPLPGNKTNGKKSNALPGPMTPAGRDREKELAGVRLTHPDKVLYAEQGITKLGLVSYYAQVADWILPHVVGRPLSLVRCPEGQGKPCFYQKHVPASAPPDRLARIAIREASAVRDYAVIKDLGGLAALVQMGVLEIHPWGARADDVGRPDRVVFDLDPGPAVAWPAVVDAARRLRAMLADLELQSFVKTSGGKGLHVVVPIQRRATWPEVKAFSQAVAQKLASEDSRPFTVRAAKAARAGKIYLDYLRNQRGATTVAAYSTRARAAATISVPLAWDELSPAIGSDHYNVVNLPPRLATLRHDPWEGFFTMRQSIRRAAFQELGL